jgi:uncharacterized membrane protein YkvA (DUF1232 family)
MWARMFSWVARPGVLRTLYLHGRVATRLLREPCVPAWLKVVPLLALGYVFWPIDIVPDFLPLAGEVDDLAVVIVALEAFLRLCPQYAVTFHRSAIAQGRRYSPTPASQTVLDADFHVSR